jgi:hypothetical protein
MQARTRACLLLLAVVVVSPALFVVVHSWRGRSDSDEIGVAQQSLLATPLDLEGWGLLHVRDMGEELGRPDWREPTLERSYRDKETGFLCAVRVILGQTIPMSINKPVLGIFDDYSGFSEPLEVIDVGGEHAGASFLSGRYAKSGSGKILRVAWAWYDGEAWAAPRGGMPRSYGKPYLLAVHAFCEMPTEGTGASVIVIKRFLRKFLTLLDARRRVAGILPPDR